jgi:hypothetical protein
VTAYLGDLREEWQCGLCCYAVSPDALHCDRDAAWHGFVLDDGQDDIVAMMSSCDEHEPFMRLSADYVHPVKHPCNIPGSWFRWPENECYTDWDDSELATSAVLAAAP